MARSGLAGPGGSLTTGISFGVPPLLKFGSHELQERFLPELLTGKKRTCIAITEPGAGSDVANITTTAVKSDDGKHYIVNGTKKWYVQRPLSSYLTKTGLQTASGPIIRQWQFVLAVLDLVACLFLLFLLRITLESRCGVYVWLDSIPQVLPLSSWYETLTFHGHH